MIYTLRNGFLAEVLKQKRTNVYWFALLAPVSMAFLYCLVFISAGENVVNTSDPWGVLLSRSFSPINNLMLPLFISVITSLVYFTEHRSHTWKHIYALPVHRASVFLSKSVFSFLLVCLTLLLYPLLIVAAGYIASYIESPLASLREMPINLWDNGILLSLKSLGASLAVWALHNWLGYRLKSYAMSIGVGLLGTITSVVMMMGSVKERTYFLYSFSSLSTDISQEAQLYENPIVLGIAIGLLLLSLSMIDATWKDMD